jgi:hypothetical protein
MNFFGILPITLYPRNIKKIIIKPKNFFVNKIITHIWKPITTKFNSFKSNFIFKFESTGLLSLQKKTDLSNKAKCHRMILIKLDQGVWLMATITILPKFFLFSFEKLLRRRHGAFPYQILYHSLR